MAVTGESHAAPRVSQPGGRPPAPGPLALVQAFVNTHYDVGADGGELLSTPVALGTWLSGHGLLDDDAPLGREDLRRTLSVREGLRALALVNNGQPFDAEALLALNDAAAGAALEIRLGPEGPSFRVAERRGLDASLAVLLGMTAQAMLDGSWPRLKGCPGEHCGWAFYDASRNQTGRWCSMSVCGGRSKARAYYRRQAARGA